MSEDPASWFDTDDYWAQSLQQEPNPFYVSAAPKMKHHGPADLDEDPCGRPHPPVGENTATGESA